MALGKLLNLRPTLTLFLSAWDWFIAIFMFVQLSFYVSAVMEIVSLRQVLKATPGLSCPP